MTRILSYNILVGGTRRIDQLTNIISSAHPDIVGLVEATNPQVVEELARRLGMQHKMSGNPKHGRDWQIALLSRLPIVQAQPHILPGILTKPVLEACIEEEDGRKLTVFVTHLAAAFYRGRGGDGIRRREVREILRIMASKRGTPHLLIGDFNAIAPGDRLKASILLRYLLDMDRRHQQNPDANAEYPNLEFVVPEPVRFLNPLLRVIPRSKLLSALCDGAGSLYAPRGSIALLYKAGYVDCFRHMNPHAWGFTCPARAPAGRIDFIFASPELAGRLSASEVVIEGNGLRSEEVSDHLPVVADFGGSVEAKFISPTVKLDENAYLAGNEEDEDIQGIGVG
jgi:endonuclease/exonuclease/phosphatase family metal-dependent hydrolase